MNSLLSPNLYLNDRNPKFVPFSGLIDSGSKFFLEFPLFIAMKGNRLELFKFYAEVCGIQLLMISYSLLVFSIRSIVIL
jgi:hypothetical protein